MGVLRTPRKEQMVTTFFWAWLDVMMLLAAAGAIFGVVVILPVWGIFALSERWHLPEWLVCVLAALWMFGGIAAVVVLGAG